MSDEQPPETTESTVGVIDDESDASAGLLTRIGRRDDFPVITFALALVVFPIFTIDVLGAIGEIIGISIGGYAGLPSLVLIYGIIVIGFNLLLGFTDMLSFGHAAFFGTAAYTAGILSGTVGSPIALVVIGTITATIIAWPIGFVSIRRSGVYFAVITLTFGQMLYFWALGPGAWLTNGDNGFSSVDYGPLLGSFELGETVFGTQMVVDFTFLEGYTWEYLFVAVLAVLAVWFANRIINSPYGLIFRGIGQNEQRVSFVGLDVFRYKLMAFIISAVFTGVGGTLFAIHESYIHPNTAYYWIQSGDFVIMTILGGVGTLIGPVFGAFIFEYVANVISGVSLPVIGAIGSLWRFVLGGIFVLIVWNFPGGVYKPVRRTGKRLVSLVIDVGGDDS